MNNSGILNPISNKINNEFRKIEGRGHVVSLLSVNSNTLMRIKSESKIVSIDFNDGSEYIWTADIEKDESLIDNKIRFFNDKGKMEGTIVI